MCGSGWSRGMEALIWAIEETIWSVRGWKVECEVGEVERAAERRWSTAIRTGGRRESDLLDIEGMGEGEGGP